MLTKALRGEIVLIGTSSFAALDATPREQLLASGCTILDNPFKRKLTKAELLDLLAQGVTGLIAGLEPLDREVLERSRLRVISRCGSGMSNVDLAAARDLGIAIYSTPYGPTLAVAELTLGALLALLRAIPRLDRAVRRGRWVKHVGGQLRGRQVAVVGFGRIGRQVAQLLTAVGASVVAVDPALSGEVEGVGVVDLETALQGADVVTIHASGEQCLLSAREFELMKKGVYVLNAARGSLIDESALLEALDSGKVAGAWLDTFWDEPYHGVLTGYEQVILTPHIGSYTFESRQRMELEAVENLISGFRKSRERARAD